MLTVLRVKNYALISDVEMRFKAGMNIITGETGAGKSILIGALGMALGKRADTSVLRNKDSKCIIEAEFAIDNYTLQEFFESYDLDYESNSIMRREISASGKSRSFINDTPVNLKALASLGNQLIEIHSQHDNLQVFKKDFQFQCLDELAGLKGDAKEYVMKYNSHKTSLNQLDLLKSRLAEYSKESDFNRFLLEELNAAQLDIINENDLTEEQELLENAEGLIQTLNSADKIFNESDFSVNEQLRSLIQLLKSHDTSLTNGIQDRLQATLIELQDISNDISIAATSVEVNPLRLEEVNEKLALLFNLRTKHRSDDVAGLIEMRDELEKKLTTSNNLGSEIEMLEETIAEQKNALEILANNLSINRLKSAEKIEEDLNQALSSIGMEHSRLRFNLTKALELTKYGLDDLDLLLSSDSGKSFATLQKAASGGELSRINLCLKNEIAQLIHLPSSVFDEIDTGVSGEIARKVGTMMTRISTNQQAIVITHLPQIASLGNNHLFVYKTAEGGDVQTKVKALQNAERIEEIAKMISGDNLTEHAVEQSKELLKG